MNHSLRPLMLVFALLAVQGCGGGGIAATACTGSCTEPLPPRLEIGDVERVISQAVAEAQARNAPATVAVVDRVGNVLGVFRMSGSDTSITISSERGVTGGLEGISVIPDSLTAISKAITGAYLSTEGNAFTSRTASQIVQQFFNPGETSQPSGPLFGVQFSSLACSDLVQRLGSTRPSVGPQRSPLGLSADPGGFPLYRNGVPIGGVGVIADSTYGADLNVRDTDVDLDELIALAAQRGFEPPDDRRADRITVDGKTLRYSDASAGQLMSAVAAPAFASLDGSAGQRLAVRGYTATADSSLKAGTRFGLAESGIRPASHAALAALDGFVLVDALDAERFAPKPGSDGASLGSTAPLAAAEVQTVLEEALKVANRARAQIRRPLSSQARVTIAVTDTHGAVLGVVRTRDAPLFGTDVALQKARSVAFFSNPAAAADLAATPDTQYLAAGGTASIADYLPAIRSFLNQPTALADGAYAYGNRSLGNVARPYFPDGIPDAEQGPLSKPIAAWSIFSTGLQLDLANSAIIKHAVFVLGGGSDVSAGSCTELPNPPGAAMSRLANGLQIFAGGVPIYRGNQLVGAIGISGDGIDQDDMVAFLGLHNAGVRLGNAISNAPMAMRADTIEHNGSRLRYAQCPQAPFIDSDEQRPCEGK
ncbi:MAG: heme-binding protein [Stagnimonas sp.]|nr:heme-binding protein [Stagnimonas sp.]